MWSGFEKKACKKVEEALKLKVFKKASSFTFQDFGETAVTSLLVCNYMNTFENPDNSQFMKAIKDYCNFRKLVCDCGDCAERSKMLQRWLGKPEPGYFQAGIIFVSA